MCFCCCMTRKSIIIYLMVINIIAFIYGIVAISEFGSSTEIYKYLINTLDRLENSSSRRLYPYPYTYSYNDYNYAKLILDQATMNEIDKLTKDDVSHFGLIRSLKGIENGLGVVIFVFTILFLAAEIVYLIFAWGTKEFQIMPTTTFNILNGVKIGVYTFSIIFIFLSLLYGILLFAAFIQWITYLGIIDSCSLGMLVGYIYGYYSFWIFITLACGFGKERSLFVEVGSEAKPGPKAEYDVNGNPIVKAVIVNPQVIVQPVGVPYQQVQVIGQQSQPVVYQQNQPMTQTNDKMIDMNSGSGRGFSQNPQNNQ